MDNLAARRRLPVARAGSPAQPGLRLVSSSPEPQADLRQQLNAWTQAVANCHDREAFGRLFAHFAPRMKGWLWKTGSSPDEAEELTQDAFVLLWRKAGQFDPARSDVGAWLFTIARNLRIDRRRASQETWTALDDPDVEAMADEAIGQEESAIQSQHGERVRLAISALTEDQRRLVQLSFYEDMSHSKIAAELELPLGTVKTRLRRAASCLRLLLEECRR